MRQHDLGTTPQHKTASRQKENLSNKSKHYINNENNQSIMQETYIQLQQVSLAKKGSEMHHNKRNMKISRRTITSNTSKKKPNKLRSAYATIRVSGVLPEGVFRNM